MGTHINPVFSGGILTFEISQRPDQEHLYPQQHRNTFKNAIEGWKFRCILITSVVIIGLVTAVYYGTKNFSSGKLLHMTDTIKDGCPAGLTTEQELILNYDGNCYFFSNTALSYSQASISCAQKKGFLAVIRDNATQIALSNYANLVTDITESSSYWIGIKRETYTQTSLGESTEFLNFDSNSLSLVQTGQKGCARLDLTEDSKWIADDCARVSWDIGHICQYTGTNGCPAGLTTEQELILNYDGNCYFFSNTALSYSQANNSCAQKEGFLAVIRDNATQIALSKHADLVSDIAESSSYWIGIKRENSTYTTTSLGESAEFLNFDSNSLSPVQTGQKGCARLDLTEDSKWIADDCARVFWDIGHICQYTGTSSAPYTKAGPGFIISILAVFLILQ
ncbi:macrophage mannose receptor 1-like isoform X1 [Mytilus edulis]|uniref:macrophage mannose receptor 1-like isoform X1 n=1 Tax=Mytilus edulis TaxID=6550 RepID=UPI0039F04DC5